MREIIGEFPSITNPYTHSRPKLLHAQLCTKVYAANPYPSDRLSCYPIHICVLIYPINVSQINITNMLRIFGDTNYQTHISGRKTLVLTYLSSFRRTTFKSKRSPHDSVHVRIIVPTICLLQIT